MSAATVSRPSSYRWLVFAVLACAYLLVYFHRTCPAVVAADLMRDLKAGATSLGMLGAAYFYPYALMQLPAGLLSDTWGPRKTITLFFSLAGVGAIWLGLAGSIGPAIAARTLVGLGVAMVFVPTVKVLTHWFTRAEFTRMMGILMALGGVGAYTAAQPLAWLSLIVGWRGSFILIGVVTLVIAGLVWVLVRNRPEDKGLPPVADSLSDPLGGDTMTLGQGIKMVLGNPRFWAVAVWFFITPGIFFSLGGLWGGPYLMQVYGLSKTQAGGILSMLAVGMIVGSPLVSWVSDKILVSRKSTMIITGVGLCLLVGILYLAPASFSPSMLYLWFFLFAVCSSAIVVIGFTTTKELFPVAIAGTSTGLINLFPFLGGAVLQPVTGWLLQIQGGPQGPYSPAMYQKVFLFYLGLSVVALICACLIKDTLPGRGAARNAA
ncbi:MAG: MFS transporter [Desulfarculus sp.]|nr:MFS transporter [Pseudomonadota bacterium]MBV1717850.1 MFS transporter [Desulfarculus sp.]MBU4576584.1 MFS transporter [Pseudomonadota bacterium]MBU4596848.1 MFS transporter [Pseudomonadota bacterium]MBV1738910.1 MFS transporter [Desulfarculus sp.]